MENIKIKLFTPTFRNLVAKFVQQHLAADSGSPVISNLKLPEHELSVIVDQRMNNTLVDNKYCSYLVLDTSKDKVIGCFLSEICDRWTSTADVASDEGPSKNSWQFQALIDFNRLMWSGMNTFMPSSYDGPYLHCILGLIDPEYRRLGINRKIFDMALERAYNEFKCKYAISMANNYKAQLQTESDGWRTLRWVKYDDYYVMGKKVFDFSADPEQVCTKLIMLDIEEWLKKRGKLGGCV